MKQIISVGLTIAMLLLESGCVIVIPNSSATTAPQGATTIPSTGKPKWGVQTKTAGCVASGGLQDKGCTPGDIIPTATKDQICVPGYSRGVRAVTTSMKNQVYASYGVTTRVAGQYEVDHLVSLELGGSNDLSNLWPEAAEPTPGFHEKDAVENYLHDQVCNGEVSLEQAQIEIATDWLAIYQRMPK